MGIESASRVLARIQESIQPDVEGRAKAARVLIDQLREAAERAGIKAVVNGNITGIQIPGVRRVDVLSDDETGNVFCQGLAVSLSYDPIAKAFVGDDWKVESAIDALTEAVRSAIEDSGVTRQGLRRG